MAIMVIDPTKVYRIDFIFIPAKHHRQSLVCFPDIYLLPLLLYQLDVKYIVYTVYINMCNSIYCSTGTRKLNRMPRIKCILGTPPNHWEDRVAGCSARIGRWRSIIRASGRTDEGKSKRQCFTSRLQSISSKPLIGKSRQSQTRKNKIFRISSRDIPVIYSFEGIWFTSIGALIAVAQIFFTLDIEWGIVVQGVQSMSLKNPSYVI